MAKKYSGEICLTTEMQRITLRLEIGDTQELEGYFELSILDVLLKKFNARTPQTEELLMVYAAMTGRDINDGEALIEACTEMTDEVGITAAIVGVKQCLWATIVSDADQQMSKELDESLGQNLGKSEAVQIAHLALNRDTTTTTPMSWTQKLLQMQKAQT